MLQGTDSSQQSPRRPSPRRPNQAGMCSTGARAGLLLAGWLDGLFAFLFSTTGAPTAPSSSSLRADVLLADQIRQGCPPLVCLWLQALFFRLVGHWLPIERFLPLISNTRGIESTPALILACVSTCAFLSTALTYRTSRGCSYALAFCWLAAPSF